MFERDAGELRLHRQCVGIALRNLSTSGMRLKNKCRRLGQSSCLIPIPEKGVLDAQIVEIELKLDAGLQIMRI